MTRIFRHVLRLFDENNEEYVYSINSSVTSSDTHFVHGIANFSGPAAESNHLTTDNEENFVLENKRIGPSPGTKGAECYCVPDGLEQHICDAGGPGTAECELSTGPLVVDRCGVGCAVGYFACCQK
ncbi:hypothetical protein FUA23_11940 [Neolewinella aurantiaca]|uniref:Uncharacterized protein n=1 Tax=Neolewinella aurantiaca TaxID=2602767 RepID=A0A5C7FUT0_9BACT|nr:hypothetical protein [Neolewinella aurantiaca]TXF89215.1 hypothetical protein FUA23_11940 [Neolewinella aurantiaca]